MKARKLIITERSSKWKSRRMTVDDLNLFLYKKKDGAHNEQLLCHPCRICIQLLLLILQKKTLTMPSCKDDDNFFASPRVGHTLLLPHLRLTESQQKTFVCHYWSFIQGWDEEMSLRLLVTPPSSRKGCCQYTAIKRERRLDGAPSIGIAFLGCD